MKPNNKLGKLRFDPEQAFESLRTKAKKVFGISKKEVDEQISQARTSRKRHKF
jgi:hypothetical protein